MSADRIVEAIAARSSAGAQPVFILGAQELMRAPVAIYDAECFRAREGRSIEVLDTQRRLRDLEQMSKFRRFMRNLTRAQRDAEEADSLKRWMLADLMEPVWREVNPNTVTTVGKNDLLDKYFAGSSYTAAWYCGLISSTSYSAISSADTMSSHAGWLEAGTANAPTYSASTRVALAFSSASAGSKATSSASSFTFSGTGTIKGMFGTSVSTKDGTTGILYNAVLFTGGDRAVVSSDVVNVSVTYSA